MSMQENAAKEIGVGQVAPDFNALNLNDKPVSFKSLIIGHKALLLFYRGSWCTNCNKQLTSISQDYERFKETGTAIIVAVSNEEVHKGKDLQRKLNLPFVLLSDTKFEGIDLYGVRDSNPSPKTRERGITELSKPAAFVIDNKGIIRYRYISSNPRDRPSNDDLLNALRASK